MYNNTDNLEVGKDFYDLNTGKYVFTVIYNNDDDERIVVEGIPVEVKSPYSNYMYQTFAYNRDTMEYYDEDGVHDFCYNNTIVSKERLDAILNAKKVLADLCSEAGITEPFVYEDGKLSVGREQVLSAHINAGYEHGWISSSICW